MIPLIAGFLLDLLLGDPRWLYHPVCLIGNLISFLEKRIRAWFPKTPKGERLGGLLEVFLVCILTAGIPFFDSFPFVPVFPAGGPDSGNLLVLSASGSKIPEDREHEGV